MTELFGQLGINLPMLAAQAVNFGVLLVVLTIFVYKPLMKALEQRRQKIELGIKGGEMAEAKLAEAEAAKQDKLKEADKKAVKIISQAEKRANERQEQIVANAHKKSESIIMEAHLVAERKKAEELAQLSREAGNLVREAVARAVSLNPEEVDRKLVEQAAALIKGKI